MQKFAKRIELARSGGLLLIPAFVALLAFLATQSELVRSIISPRESAKRGACQTNLQQLGLAFAQYTRDFDSKYPPATLAGVQGRSASVTSWPANPPVGWADIICVWGRSGTIVICYSEPTQQGSIGNPSGNPAGNNFTDFWFNSNLSTVSSKSLSLPSSTILVGDGSDGRDVTNATYNKSSLPASWLTDTSSPAYRHLGGANYLMADGAVHWLKPQQVTTFGGRKNAFAVK